MEKLHRLKTLINRQFFLKDSKCFYAHICKGVLILEDDTIVIVTSKNLTFKFEDCNFVLYEINE